MRKGRGWCGAMKEEEDEKKTAAVFPLEPRAFVPCLINTFARSNARAMKSNSTQNEPGDGMAGSEVSATPALHGGTKNLCHALSLLRGSVSIAVRPCC